MRKQFACHLSRELHDLASFLYKRDEISRVVFTRRAVRYFMTGDRKIDPPVLITERSDPEYLNRGALWVVQMDEEQRKQIEEVAEENFCTVSQVFFQIMIDYCALLITQDDTGIIITEKE